MEPMILAALVGCSGFAVAAAAAATTPSHESGGSGNDNSGVVFVLIVIVIILMFLILAKEKKGGSSKKRRRFAAIEDKFRTTEEVHDALRKAGLEASQLIVGIDCTASNEWSGKRTFHGRPLHSIMPNGSLNPYQTAISVIGRTLASFDADGTIPAFYFGDEHTMDRSVAPLRRDGRDCQGLADVLQQYSAVVPTLTLSGPTSFAPLIRRAMAIVEETQQYHILLIIADGQVTRRRETEQAIVEAAKLPLSIVIVGVGDGPWDQMEHLDDELPARERDMVQFVNFDRILRKCQAEERSFEAAFAVAALQEIPDQYRMLQEARLL